MDDIAEKYQKLMAQYQEQFDDQFPLMLCRTFTNEEIFGIIEQCIKDNTPYQPELDDDADY